VFEHTYHALPPVDQSAELLAKWQSLRAVRAEVLKQIEAERTAGHVGSSLQAEVTVNVPSEQAALLQSLGDELRFVLITSAAKVAAADNTSIGVVPSAHQKCERCWHYRADVGSVPAHPTICARCVSNLDGDGEARLYA
jgi:isoleucyl-tRNA synthetase